MDATTLLSEQHREVEAFFRKYEKATSDEQKIAIFNLIADNLADCVIQLGAREPTLRSGRPHLPRYHLSDGLSAAARVERMERVGRRVDRGAG